jgi:hypothetical protein
VTGAKPAAALSLRRALLLRLCERGVGFVGLPAECVGAAAQDLTGVARHERSDLVQDAGADAQIATF